MSDNRPSAADLVKQLGEHVKTLGAYLLPRQQATYDAIRKSTQTIRRAIREMETRQQASDRLNSALIQLLAATAAGEGDMETLILDLFMQAFNAERGYLLRLDPDSGQYVPASYDMQPEDHDDHIASVMDSVLTTGEMIITDNAATDDRLQNNDNIVGHSLKHLAGIPLKTDDTVIGMIYLDKRISAGLFSEDDHTAMITLAQNTSRLLATETRQLDTGLFDAVEDAPAPEPAPPAPGYSSGLFNDFDDEESTDAALPDIALDADDGEASESENPDWLVEPDEPLPPEKADAAPSAPQIDFMMQEHEEPSGALPEVEITEPTEPVADETDDSMIVFEDAPPPRKREAALAERNESGILTPSALPKVSDVQFSAYYPGEIKLDEWHPLHAYLLKTEASHQVREDIQGVLGEQASAYREIVQTASQPIHEGAMITATPHLPGFQVNPPSISMGFYEDWHRFDFKIRARNVPLYHAINGMLTFSIDGIVIGDIPVAIFITDAPEQHSPATTLAQPYSAIFCSYSHDDTQIVERVERAFQSLGIEYLRDVHSLKSGQHWTEELYRLIDKSQIFQLFWSGAAAQSPFVQKEWEYALNLSDREHFIRPVYWQYPMPVAPDALSHLHFTYQPDLAE